MGGALCYGIGAAYAALAAGQGDERDVHVVIGDGGMQLNIQELQTLKINERALRRLHVWILNNHCYGITRQYQLTASHSR